MSCQACRDSGIVRLDGSKDLSRDLTMSELLLQCDPCLNPGCQAGRQAVIDFKAWRSEWSKPIPAGRRAVA
jgi:hypothetical protein